MVARHMPPAQPEPLFIQLPLPLDCGLYAGAPELRFLEKALGKVLKAFLFIERESMDEARFSVWYSRTAGVKVTGVQEMHNEEF